MAVIRNNLKDNFTQIPNELLIDSRLSMGAKVVFCYVASKPTGWEVYNKEIQKALNIKDNGTIAKYWKELLDAGWIERERTQKESGKLTGGFDYVLMVTPGDRIQEKPVNEEKPANGKTPEYNNTDLNNNINLNNNIIITETDKEEINNSSNQLFPTPSKPKKGKQNGYIDVIQSLSGNQKIREALEKYCNFRRKRGLTVDQWQLIVSKFKEDSKDKSVNEIIECIEQCVINGRNSLYYSNSTNNQNKKGAPVTHPEDNSPSIIRRSRESKH